MHQQIETETINILDQLKNYFQNQRLIYGDDIYINFNPQALAQTSSEQQRNNLLSLHIQVKECRNCELAKTRTKLVFGSGDPASKILLIGEAPGANEDAQGKPFVGEAGKLLDKILSAIKLSRSDVFVTNVVKCRPPNNRDPLPEEIGACASILEQQLEILKPKFILILGRIAAQSLLKTAKALRELRGQVVELFNAQVVVTYHPSALLREPALKRSAWEDVQLFQKLCERTES